jgi:putative transposase
MTVGDLVWHKGRRVRILSVGDLESFVVADSETGQTLVAKLVDLSTSAPQPSTPPEAQTQPAKPLEGHRLKVAQSRYEVIEPLLNGPTTGNAAAVKTRARAKNVHFTTLYRWLRLFQQDGDLAALAPRPRKGRLDRRIEGSVEAIIAAAIDEVYIKGGLSVRRVNSAIRKQCKASGLAVPHKDTVRRRIAEQDPLVVAQKRLGNAAALALRAVQGSDPRATQPLALVQMDHTLLPVYVSRKHLKPFRPWLTIVLDVYSRMVIGFALTLRGPSANTVGLALTHAFLPKDDYLKTHGVSGEWPCWGIMDILACDNGSDFRGKVLEKVCESPRYAITQDFRPVAQPQYGAHIERFARTLKSYVRDITGSIGPTKRQRLSGKHHNLELFTLGELEGWLTELIVSVYHNNQHSALGMTPLEKYRQGIHGTPDQPGRGVPPILSPGAVRRLRLDFLPSEPRTVQRQGISLNGIKYSHLALERFLDERDRDRLERPRKFDVRYDPADVRSVYFLDPETDE